MRSFGKVKYWIFAILSINLFQYCLDTYVNDHRIKKLLNVFWFSIICAAVYGLCKSYPARVSSFTGTMRYGYGMGLALTLMFGIWFHLPKLNKTISKKFFYWALTLGVLGFLATKTRGALLGFIVSIPFLFYFYKKKLGLAVGVVVSVILAVVILISLNGGSESFRLLKKFGNSSNLKRVAQYEAAIRSINDRPLVGLGINNFSSRCLDIKKEYDIHWPKYCAKHPALKCSYKPIDHPVYCGHAHNIFLEHGANMGVIGALLLFLWLMFWIYELWKLNTVSSKIIIPFAINIFISGQFENIFDANNSFFIFFVYSLSFLIKNKDKQKSPFC
jgi:O-antigen ligase